MSKDPTDDKTAPPDDKPRPVKLPHDDQQFISPGQVALRTGLSRRTIYKYCKPGANPYLPHKNGPGGRILIDRDDVDPWLDLFEARRRRPRSKR